MLGNYQEDDHLMKDDNEELPPDTSNIVEKICSFIEYVYNMLSVAYTNVQEIYNEYFKLKNN